jgi:hypothetical protein
MKLLNQKLKVVLICVAGLIASGFAQDSTGTVLQDSVKTDEELISTVMLSVDSLINERGENIEAKVKKEFQKLSEDLKVSQKKSQKKSSKVKRKSITTTEDLYGQMKQLSSYLSELIVASGTTDGIVVMPFDCKHEKLKELQLGQTVMELLTTNLSNTPDVTLVDRQNIDKIMQELTFSMSGMVDEATAASIGNMIGAKVMVLGSIMPLGTGDMLIVSRATNVETGEIIASADLMVKQSALISEAAKNHDIQQKPVSAAFRSLLIPGWGQFENGHNVRGGLYLASGIASLGGFFYFNSKANYYDGFYENANSTESADAAKEDREDMEFYRNISLGIYGGVVGVSIIDAIISTVVYNARLSKGKVSDRRVSLQYDLQSNETHSLAFNLSF